MAYLARDTLFPRAFIYASNVDALVVQTILPECRISLLNSFGSNSLDPIFHLSASNDMFKIQQTSNEIASFYSRENYGYMQVQGRATAQDIYLSKTGPRQLVFSETNPTNGFVGMGFTQQNLTFQVPTTTQGYLFQVAEGAQDHPLVKLHYDTLTQEPRMGLGNMYPQHALDVYGDIYSTGTLVASNLRVIGQTTILDTVTSNTEQIVVTNSGDGPALLVTQTGPNTIAEFYDGTDIVLMIDDNRKVGINTMYARSDFDVQGMAIISGNLGIGGTLLPSYPLDIIGDIQYSGNLYKNGELVITSTFTSWVVDPATSNVYNIIGNVGIGTTTPRHYLDVEGGNVILNHGNLGIGTLFPFQPFHVVGESFLQGNLGIGTAPARQALDIQGGSAHISERVGIATAYPRQPLDVVGNTVLSGSLGVGTVLPAANLHIATATPTIQLDGTANGNTINIRDTSYLRFGSDASYKTHVLVVADSWAGGPNGRINLRYKNYLALDAVNGVSGTGVEKMRITDIGNVGIGTTQPRQLLDVQGGSAIVSGSIGIGTTLPLQPLHVQGQSYFTTNLGIGTASPRQLLDIQGGSAIVSASLGIGTTLPVRTLHVQGQSYFSTNVGVGTTLARQLLDVQGGNAIVSGSIGIGTTLPRYLLDVEGGSAIVSGSIGIGTTVPLQTFHVQGPSYFSTNVGIGTTLTRQLLDVEGGNAIVSGSIGIGTTIPLQTFHVQGQSYFTTNVGIGTTLTRQLLDVEGGNAIVSGSIGIGTTLPIQTLHVQGQSYFTTNVGIGTTLTRQLLDVQGGNAIVSGSIGIGTTVPLRTFHVQGQSYFSTNVGIGTTLIRQLLDVEGGNAIVSGNLGVGTYLPIQPLHIVGQSYFSTYMGLGTTLPRQLLDVEGGNAIVSGSIGIGTTVPLRTFHVQGQSYFSTNVGIGTTLSRQLLDVQGGNAIVSGSIGIGTTVPIRTLHIQGQSYFSTNVGIGTTLARQLLDVEGGNAIVSGSIGIGTTLPFQALHVQGQSFFSSLVGVGTGTPRQLLDVQGGNAIVSGNMGIGTVLPLQPLHVQGQSFFATNLGIGTTLPRQLVDIEGGNLILTHNMGIGTIAPSAPIELWTSPATPQVVNGILLTNSTTEYDYTSLTGTAIAMQTRKPSVQTVTVAKITMGTMKNTYGSGQDDNGVIRFETANAGVVSPKVLIAGNGYTGIGTTLPRYLLDIEGGHTILNGGNLGIGTTVPLRTLHVQGQGFISGNLGIGTTLPVYPLDIYGGLKVGQGAGTAADTVLLQFDTQRAWQFLQRGTGAATTLALQCITSGKNFQIQDQSGNTFANFFAKSTTDSVNSNASWFLSAGIGTNYSDTKPPANSFIVQSRIGVGTTLPREALDVADGYAIISGNVGIGTTIPVRNLDIRGDTITTRMGVNTTDPTRTLQVEGDSILHGNVGISTADPRYPLHIHTNDHITVISQTGKMAISKAILAVPTSELDITSSATSGTYAGILLQNYGNTNPGPSLRIQTTRHDATLNASYAANIGLARHNNNQYQLTQTPLGGIHFGGNHTNGSTDNIGYMASMQGIADGNFVSSTSAPVSLAFYTGSNSYAYTDTSSSSKGNEVMRLTYDGKVGIQTTVPLYTMDVRGTTIISGNLGIGTTYPEVGFTVYGNAYIGAGMKGVYNSFAGGPFYKQKGWDATGTTHTISYPEYCVADNSSGTLHIQVKSATNKLGNVSLSFLKAFGTDVDTFSIYYHKTDNLTTFSLAVSGTDIVVSTDSDCCMCWSSIGAC